MKNKTLLLIFLLFLIGFLASQFIFEQKKRIFKTALIQLDTTAITTILLYPKSDHQKEILLKKEQEFWVISRGNVTNKANPASVSAILKNLSLIQTKQVATQSQEEWGAYGVEEKNGNRIKVYAGAQLLEEFIVGRYKGNQQTKAGISYLRLAGEEEVYAVDGLLSRIMGQGFEAYRNKIILNTHPRDLTQITINTLDSLETTTILQKNGAVWTQDNGPIDSTTLVNYLYGLQQINGNTFADDFEDLQSNDKLFKTLTIAGNNLTPPILIKAFKDTTRIPPFVIQSSLNPDNYFESEEYGIVEQLFGGW